MNATSLRRSLGEKGSLPVWSTGECPGPLPVAQIATAICLLLTLAATPGVANDTHTPQIAFDAKEKDLGTIAEGEDIEFEFTVQNTGNADLKIIRLRALCDCTEVSVLSSTIAPGGSTTLEGTFRSAGRWGNQDKIIVVSSNARNAPESPLKVRLLIESGVRVTPRSFSFGEIGRKGSVTKTVKIEANLERKLAITAVDILDTDAVTAKLGKSKVKSTRLPNSKKGFQTTLDVSLTAKNKEAGAFSGELQLKTDSRKNPIIKVLFSGECEGDITAAPALAQFRGAPSDVPLTAEVTLSSVTRDEFTVTGIDPGGLPISLAHSQEEAAREQKVTLAFTPPEDPKPFYRGYVFLLTDHPTHKRVKAGVNAISPKAATVPAGDAK